VISKKASFWETIDFYDPPIICGCETWLNSNILNNEILPPSYKVYRNDRADGYGGVLIGVKTNILSDQIDPISHLEVCTVLLCQPKILLICAYRPPNADMSYQNRLCEYIITMARKYPDANVCCTGDFNLPDICWETQSTNGYRYPIEINKLALNMCEDCGFTQVVTFPTRAQNTLDLFFTTQPSLVEDCKWGQANLEGIREDILAFASVFTHENTVDTPVEELWCTLRDALLDVIDKHVPHKVKSEKNRKPWINHNLKRLRRKKQQSYNRARSTNLPAHWSHYRRLKKEMQKECRSSFNEYMSSIIHESYENGKNKKLFSYIKSLRKDYCGVDTLQKDGISFSENQDKANILNQYFSSVFTKDSDSNLPMLDSSPYPEIPQFEVTLPGVCKLLDRVRKLREIDIFKFTCKLLSCVGVGLIKKTL